MLAWMHGGAFIHGGAASPEYHGADLAAQAEGAQEGEVRRS